MNAREQELAIKALGHGGKDLLADLLFELEVLTDLLADAAMAGVSAEYLGPALCLAKARAHAAAVIGEERAAAISDAKEAAQ